MDEPTPSISHIDDFKFIENTMGKLNQFEFLIESPDEMRLRRSVGQTDRG